ncbi:ATP-binding protein [Actinoallomurus soli]|uniref:ATP-binding protein n=1 Tax=Actinoallomurus soli TaxID=2952535 RepID=UPI0020934439|nr:ATP-binding protein [Actinoallomurus soli]MCO5969302.1 ATP-binding protein [Actinoallomurus soli]
MSEWAMEVAGSPSMVPGVRHWVREVLGDFPEDARDRMEIIASEYATNCVRHSTAAEGGHIRLRLTADGERIRLEVRDEGPRRGASDVWAADEAADFGRGLHIVTQLADVMGDEVSSEGRLAWAEVKA